MVTVLARVRRQEKYLAKALNSALCVIILGDAVLECIGINSGEFLRFCTGDSK
jgi:hypothetical protein